MKIGFDELYVVLERASMSECLYDHDAAIERAKECDGKVMTLESWLYDIGVFTEP